MLWRRMFSLGLLTTIVGCAGSSKEIVSLDCKPSIGSSCSAQVSGGSRVEFVVEDYREGEEYIFLLYGEDDPDPERMVRNRFQVTSTHRSRYLTEEELDDYQYLIRRTPPLNQQDTQYSQIPVANNLLVNESPLTSEFYVPEVDDYYTEVEGKKRMFNLRYHSDPEVSGERIEPNLLYTNSGNYSILMNQELPSASADPNDFRACLDENLAKLYEITDPPLDIDGIREFSFLVTPLYSSLGKVAGLFNYLDMFDTYKGESIPDSNARDVVYLAPYLGELTCAVGIHEMQHRLRFEHAVYRQIDPRDRSELESVLNYGLRPEVTSFNEGASHTVEELTGATQQVGVYASSFLKNPDGASLSLEHADGSRLENYRTRGFAYSILQYAISRAGGRLSFDDPLTKKFLRHLIRSREIGLKNIADYFEVSPEEFIADYFQSFVNSLFHGSSATGLFPLIEVSETGISRGVEILPRSTNVEDWDPEQRRSIHPLSFPLQLLPRAKSFTLRPQSIRLFRYIVPNFDRDRRSGDAKVVFKSSQSPYSIFAIRVR